MRFVPVSDAQVAPVAQLAQEIWHEYYVPLIGRAQVEYMVARFQSEAAIRAQIHEGYEYFVIELDDVPAGYLALRVDRDGLFLSKLYVHGRARGTGLGGAALAFVEEFARRKGLPRVWLTVNKGNPARQVYERKGFRVMEAIVVDIGGGFVMDDYRMEKFLT